MMLFKPCVFNHTKITRSIVSLFTHQQVNGSSLVFSNAYFVSHPLSFVPLLVSVNDDKKQIPFTVGRCRGEILSYLWKTTEARIRVVGIEVGWEKRAGDKEPNLDSRKYREEKGRERESMSEKETGGARSIPTANPLVTHRLPYS